MTDIELYQILARFFLSRFNPEDGNTYADLATFAMQNNINVPEVVSAISEHVGELDDG